MEGENMEEENKEKVQIIEEDKEEVQIIEENIEEIEINKEENKKPDFRVVQPSTDKDGKPILINIGGMWKKTSKTGNVFYVLRIGKLKLLVFENKP
jgi:uncharacterized protein (DUF736 family)